MSKQEKEKSQKQAKGVRQQKTEEERLQEIELQKSETIRLSNVFDKLCAYEAEKSSDDDNAEKKYKKKIEEKANEKKMKIPKCKYKFKLNEKKNTKKFKEDEDEEVEKEKKPQKKKFSKKALRKVIRTLCDEFAKDELDKMIWEVDENLDGYVSEKEFSDMYKKCIADEKEEEGKKLFYLVQFLMYDKDDKHLINVEDTLEILCARNPNNVDPVIDAIFGVDYTDEKGNKKKRIRETITFLEYAQRMHELSMAKRNEISNRKKTFCDAIKEQALKDAQERAAAKGFS